MQPEVILGVSRNATIEDIETAYERQMSRWQGLLTNPAREIEAQEMIQSLDEAREALLARLDAGEGELLFRPNPVVNNLSPTPSDVDARRCPNCGYTANPAGARFCTNPGCGEKLVHKCPKCEIELPWYQEVCHKCGMNYDDATAEIERVQDAKRRQHEVQILQANVQQIRSDLEAAKSVSPATCLGIGCTLSLAIAIGPVLIVFAIPRLLSALSINSGLIAYVVSLVVGVTLVFGTVWSIFRLTSNKSRINSLEYKLVRAQKELNEAKSAMQQYD